MNILFKEFAERATINIGDEFHPIDFFDKEKFAQLIVRECDRYARSAWEHGPLLGRDLLIHFGVEEMSDE